VGVEPGEVEASRYQEYRPEYRSGGFTVCGIRDTLEDALVCIDDLEEHLGSRGAFYGVCGQCITQCWSGIVSF
jgi:protein phosphatase 2C family protein 2/3